jgi:hypothetical protein
VAGHRQSLAQWSEVLTGIESGRCIAALDRVARWKLAPVSAELLADDVDAAVAATLLVEGMDALVARGVPEIRLLKKLRTGDFWPTWAEIRIADMLVRLHEEPLDVELEAERTKGAHADWRFRFPGSDDAVSVEVKAVGLSDDEVAFCTRMAPALKRMLPKHGLVQAHAGIGTPSLVAPAQMRRRAARGSRAGTRKTPSYPVGLRGAVVVAQDSEESYRRRISARVRDAVRQLPTQDECWVALYWSNGAPLASVAAGIDWSQIPEHVSGLLMFGQAVAFPDRQIHVFASRIERGGSGSSSGRVDSLEGEAMQHVAELVLARFERSSGVRATLLRVGNRDLVRRDGSRRILPFNLLMDVDPEFGDEASFSGRAP